MKLVKSLMQEALNLVDDLERADVTILSVTIQKDYKDPDIPEREIFSIQCWGDEWFAAFMQKYSHETRQRAGANVEVIPFLRGEIFAFHSED